MGCAVRRLAQVTIAYNRPSRPNAAPRPLVRNTVVTLVLAILAAATWIATWQREAASPPADRAAETQPLGYYARGARVTGTDEQGRPTYRIFADRLEELPGEDRLQLTGVNVDYQPSDETAWTLTAATAKYERDGSLIDLKGNVEVRSSPTAGAKPLTFSTESLVFSPDTSSAESDAAVAIRVGDWQLDAIGLHADLKEHTLALESVEHATLLSP
jgi:lipopolysaccharide export system protein LptC